MSTAEVLWSVLRRSTALPATPVFIVVVALYLGLRPHLWEHEWYWTIDSFNFVTILLAPLVAGIATWDGARWSTATESALARGRSQVVLASAIAPVGLCATIVFLGGLIVAGAHTSLSGTPGVPSLRELAAALPAVAILIVAASTGAVVGWLGRRTLAGPIVAVVTFAVFLAGYTVLPQNLLRIGGATGSLLALAPRPELQVLQVLFYTSIGGAIVMVAHLRRAKKRSAIGLVPIGVASALGIGLATIGGMRFVESETSVHCAGVAPQICLAPGYEALRSTIHQETAQPFNAFEMAGYVPPLRLSQDVFDDRPGTAQIGTDTPTTNDVHNLLVTTLIPADCDVLGDEVTYRRYITLWAWVGRVVGVEITFDPNVDPTVAKGDSPESRRIIDTIVSELTACDS